jgi:hypothetical protein
VPLRRIRSNCWHAREKVSGPEAVATNKEQLLARPRAQHLRIYVAYELRLAREKDEMVRATLKEKGSDVQ